MPNLSIIDMIDASYERRVGCTPAEVAAEEKWCRQMDGEQCLECDSRNASDFYCNACHYEWDRTGPK